jgi:hypothetical protein
MMATTIKQTEAVPEDIPDDICIVQLSAAAKAIPLELAWQRIEAYIAYRWTPRAVTWIVEGPGEWHPALAPATVDTVEVWDRGEFVETSELCASPYGGFVLPSTGPYRFTGTVGGSSPELEVPAIVLEAFRRLAEYMAAPAGEAGARQSTVSIESINESYSKNEAWVARAMQNSGAADLLRSYRRAA